MTREIVRFLVLSDGAGGLRLLSTWADQTSGEGGRISMAEWFRHVVSTEGLAPLLGVDAATPLGTGYWVFEGKLWTRRSVSGAHGEDWETGFDVMRQVPVTTSQAVAEALRVDCRFDPDDLLSMLRHELFFGVGILAAHARSVEVPRMGRPATPAESQVARQVLCDLVEALNAIMAIVEGGETDG